MAKEYIDREAVIAPVMEKCIFCKHYYLDRDGVRCPYCTVSDVIEILKKQPASDVVPVRHGRWKPGDMPTYGGYKCSVCGGNTTHFKANFCPNCGADMREKSEDIPMEYFESGGK